MAAKDMENVNDEITGKSRLLRNEGEKLRRDRLNSSISELGQMLPVVTKANRKVDKSTILRQATNYLRFYKDFVEDGDFSSAEPNLKYLQRLSSILLESRRGFLFVLSQDGTLVFANELLTSQLGHNLLDVIGMSFYNLIHPEDLDVIPKIIDKYSEDPNSFSVCSCYVRISSTLTFHQNHYECVHIQGFLRKVAKLKPAFSTSKKKESDEIYLIAVGRIVTEDTIKEISMLSEEVGSDVWVTQSSLDGHVLHLSQSYALIFGRLPSEAVNVSSYDVLHKNDIPVCARQHVKALQAGARDVLGTYLRFYDTNKDMIYAYCTTHMVTNPWTKKLKYIVTVHHVISDEEGEKQIELQMERMSSGMSRLSIEGSPSYSDVFDLESPIKSETADSLNDNSANRSEASKGSSSDTKMPATGPDLALDDSCETLISCPTEKKIDFIPELLQLTKFVSKPDESEQEKLLQEFKDASENYKKQAGVATKLKQKSGHGSKTGSSAKFTPDNDTMRKNSSQMLRSTEKKLEVKSAYKRKNEKTVGSAIKTPLLHDLLTQGESSPEPKYFRNLFDVDFKVGPSESQKGNVSNEKEEKCARPEDTVEQVSSGNTGIIDVQETKNTSKEDTQLDVHRERETVGTDVKEKDKNNPVDKNADDDLTSGSSGSSSEVTNMKPDSSQCEVDMTIQLRLADQLQGKYELLQEKLVSQEKEISELKAKTELYLSLSPANDNEAQKNLLHQLESKRKQHEKQLLKLKQDYAVQMSALTMDRRSYVSDSSTRSTSSSVSASPRSGSSLSSGTNSRSNSVSPMSEDQGRSPYPDYRYQQLSPSRPYGGNFMVTSAMQPSGSYQKTEYSTSPVEMGYISHSEYNNESFPSTTDTFYHPINSPKVMSSDVGPYSVQSPTHFGGFRMAADVPVLPYYADSFDTSIESQHQIHTHNISRHSPNYAPSPEQFLYVQDAWANSEPQTNVSRGPCKDPSTCPTGGHCDDPSPGAM